MMDKETFAATCELIASGLSIRKACAHLGFDQRELSLYLDKNESEVPQYVRARERRADMRFEKVDEIMEDMRLGKLDPQQARVLLDAVKWQTAKEAPKRYGDSLKLDGEVKTDNRLEIVRRVIGKDGTEREA